MSRYSYFDNAATTRLDPQVRRAMMPFWLRKFGNASSIHKLGQEASASITKARKLIADFLFCEPEELIFTSGATESDNLAIKGIVNYYQNLFQVNKRKKPVHIITTKIEHPAVLESFLSLERQGVSASFVGAEPSGKVDIEKIIKEITDQTVLISLIYVNNETGIVQDVQTLGKKLIEINQERLQEDKPRIYYHIDAVQGLNYENCRPDHLKADLISFSGHKIYGPKGIGILYSREKTPLLRLSDGGL